MKKTLILITTILLSAVYVHAQEKEEKGRLDFNLDLKTSHLWRGIIVSDVPITAIDINYALDKNKHLKVGVWGGLGITDHKDEHYNEINYYINYGNSRYGIGIWDVFTSGAANSSNSKYSDIWNYSRKSTGHRFDLRGYAVFSEQIPVRLEYGTSFYGDDKNSKGDQRFSSYAEVSYPVIKGKEVDLTAFCGAGFGLTGDSHFYGDGKNNFDLVNVGFTATKKVSILGHKIPVSATTMWNPSNKEARVQLATSLF